MSYVSPATGSICRDCHTIIDPGVPIDLLLADGVTCVCKPCRAIYDKKKYLARKKAAEKEKSKPKPIIVKQLAKAGRIPERPVDTCFSKACSKCGVVKQFTAFYKIEGKPSSQCRECHQKYVAARYVREKKLAKKKEKEAVNVKVHTVCRPQIADYLL